MGVALYTFLYNCPKFGGGGKLLPPPPPPPPDETLILYIVASTVHLACSLPTTYNILYSRSNKTRTATCTILSR